MKRTFAALNAALLIMAFPAETVVFAVDKQTGTCGKSITWELDGDTLYLNGKGATDQGLLLPAQIPVHAISVETLNEWQNEKWADICDQVKHIVLCEGITEVSDQAFCMLPQLESVKLPDSLQRIGIMTFAGCPKLSNITITGNVQICDDSFEWDCSLYNPEKPFFMVNDSVLAEYGGNTDEVLVPNKVKTIMRGAFAKHTELKKAVLPQNTMVIDQLAFEDCENLSDVIMPDSLVEIGRRAFSGCRSLKNLTIPSSVQFIGEEAFQDNPWLASYGDFVVLGDGILYRFQGRQKIVPLPDAVKSINKDALSGDKIFEIQIPEAVTEIQTGAIQCSHAVIAGSKGSAAEIYAVENQLQFRDVNAAAPQGTDLTINCEKDGWYFGNSGDYFGSEYFLTDADRQRLKDFGRDTQGVDKAWEGSCVGLALTAILMKNGVFQPSELQDDAKTLSDVEPTDAVRSFINYYQCTQGRDDTTSGMSDFQKVYYMSQHLPNVKHGESPFLLAFDCEGGGSHGVIAYDLEEGAWTYFGRNYDRRILVWDSNFPGRMNDGSCLYFDSLTLDYCIPAYGIHVAEGASDNTDGLVSARNDLNALNAYPYQFPDDKPGDVNLDDSVTVADAVLLCKHLSTEAQLTGRALRLADLSTNLEVDAADLTLLKRLLLL